MMTLYLKNHWFGRLPLWQTVWINLVSLLVFTDLLLAALIPKAAKLNAPLSWSIVGPVIIAYLALVVWQVTGTLRAMEQHIRDGGGMPAAWGIQAGLLAAFWVILANVWGLWLTTTVVIETENFEERMEREHASKYSLQVSDDGQSVQLQGEITLGVTKKFELLLNNAPNLQTVVLESGGGNIYEARGLAKRISEAGINTHVQTECSSACTLAFIGGVQRTMENAARLGFHQYRIDADYVVAFADPEAEQARDKALFAAAGVKESFLSAMFEQTAAAMWFPEKEVLLEAGVLTGSSD